MALSCAGGGSGWILGNIFFSQKSCNALQHIFPGSGVVTVPEVFQNHGDVALRNVVSGHGGVGWGCV